MAFAGSPFAGLAFGGFDFPGPPIISEPGVSFGDPFVTTFGEGEAEETNVGIGEAVVVGFGEGETAIRFAATGNEGEG